MPLPVHPVAQSLPAHVAAPSASNAITAGAVASANAPAKATSSTKIGSMEDLKKKAPEVYNKMLEGIAMNICGHMREYAERFKKILREGQNP